MGVVLTSAALAGLGGLGLLWDKNRTDARKEILAENLPAEGYKTNLWQKIHGLNGAQLNKDKTKLMRASALDSSELQQRAELLGWSDEEVENKVTELLRKDAIDGVYSINSGVEAANRILNSTREKAETAQRERKATAAQENKAIFGTPENQEQYRRDVEKKKRIADESVRKFDQSIKLATMADLRNQANRQFADAAADRNLTLQLKSMQMAADREDRRYYAERDDRRDRLQMMQLLMNGITNSAKLMY